jgi:CRP-like cAMP-binding protein
MAAELHQRVAEQATERVEQRIARALLRLVRQAGRKVEGGVLVDLQLSRQDQRRRLGQGGSGTVRPGSCSRG